MEKFFVYIISSVGHISLFQITRELLYGIVFENLGFYHYCDWEAVPKICTYVDR